jgi:2,4-dienoyl-CoA reductase-like NADH-dependent reductase (Old Yellow Enzyme family)
MNVETVSLRLSSTVLPIRLVPVEQLLLVGEGPRPTLEQGEAAAQELTAKGLERVGEQTVPPLLVGVRLSPEDRGQATGLDLDENITLARWLVDDGVHLRHLSLWDVSKNTQKRPDQHPIPLFLQAIDARVPLVVAGNSWTRATPKPC